MGDEIARGVQTPGEPETDGALHRRLLAGDPIASSDFASRHLGPLVDWLARAYRVMDAQVLEEVAIDLIMSVAAHPEQFDPGKASLSAYLRMAAKGDVLNRQRSITRRAQHEIAQSGVELSAAAGNRETVSEDFVEALARRDHEQVMLDGIRAHCTEAEWHVLRLMMDGERRTSAFAAILGLTKLPDLEQAREVKKVKDRLVKRLRRLSLWNERDD